jgi:hypothetical protein
MLFIVYKNIMNTNFEKSDIYELIDFGDACGPSILIKNILGIKKKTLFMIGGYYFNDIIKYLEEDKLEEIYNKDYLTNEKYEKINKFTNKMQRYCESQIIRNVKYGFNFIHDFGYNPTDNSITNYNFICNEFDKKIASLKESFANEKILIFIHFNRNKHNINTLNIVGMINVLNKFMSKNFYIFIFTNQDTSKLQKYREVKYIVLDNVTEDFWSQSTEMQNIMCDEIHSKFCVQMSKFKF